MLGLMLGWLVGWLDPVDSHITKLSILYPLSHLIASRSKAQSSLRPAERW